MVKLLPANRVGEKNAILRRCLCSTFSENDVILRGSHNKSEEQQLIKWFDSMENEKQTVT